MIQRFRPPTGRRRLLGPLLAIVAAATMATAALAGPAAAHDGDAVLTVEATHPAGTSIHYIVRVTWADDGHPAADATVTATGVAPDGTSLTPVTLAPADDDGRYAGVVEYPEAGAWTVRITAIEPTGTVEQAQEVTAPATTVPDQADGDDADAPTDEGFAPQDDDTGDSASTTTDGDSDDSGMPIYLAIAAAAVVIVGAVTAVNIIRRNRPGTSTAAATAGDGNGRSVDDPDEPGVSPTSGTAASGATTSGATTFGATTSGTATSGTPTSGTTTSGPAAPGTTSGTTPGPDTDPVDP